MGGIGQADGPDGGGEVDGTLQLQHSDVVVVGEVIELGVGDDALDAPLLHHLVSPLTLVVKPEKGRPLLGVRVPAQRHATG